MRTGDGRGRRRGRRRAQTGQGLGGPWTKPAGRQGQVAGAAAAAGEDRPWEPLGAGKVLTGNWNLAGPDQSSKRCWLLVDLAAWLTARGGRCLVVHLPPPAVSVGQPGQ